MSSLVQLVYVSRVTFDAPEGPNREVMKILTEARNKNPPKGIGGVLYFKRHIFRFYQKAGIS